MVSKLKVAINEHLKSMLDLHDLTDKQAKEILALRIRHQLPRIDKDEINEWLNFKEPIKIDRIVGGFKVGDKVQRVVPLDDDIVWTITHITSIGELVIETEGYSSAIVSTTAFRLAD
jgi:hypothetical protein